MIWYCQGVGVAIRQGEDLSVYRCWGSSWLWLAQVFSFSSPSFCTPSVSSVAFLSYSSLSFNTLGEVHDSFFFGVFSFILFFSFSLFWNGFLSIPGLDWKKI